MALGRYTRVGGNKSSSGFCSSVGIVCFVALCLIGVWMMTSSSVDPVQNNDVSSRAQISDSNESTGTTTSDNTQASVSTDKGSSSDDTQQEHNLSNANNQKFPMGDEKSKEMKSEEKKGDDQTEEKIDKKSEEKEQNNDIGNDQVEEKVDDKKNDNSNQGSEEKNMSSQAGNQSSTEVYPSVSQADLLNETSTQNGSFSTQAAESKNENEAQMSSGQETQTSNKWKWCNTTAGPDFIPCLDNVAAIKHLKTTMHYQHRERHCPDSPPTCLVPLPEGYQRPIAWPTSREKIWYHNVPHSQLAAVKGSQNWVKVSGEYLIFPGGGTQFQHGALHYIDNIQESVPDIDWGKRSRVVLDVGCGVASFSGYIFDRNVLTMSLAPKDEHEAQVQFALERGIPAISAVMGTKRLPYPGRVFDVVHCARCRVPWHIEGGKLLLELNRLLRPGGFFIWSATPVYDKNDPEDVQIWKDMEKLTKSMCWEVVSITKDKVNEVGIAIYRKPASNKCYDQRKENVPPLCPNSDDPNAAWNVALQVCMHKIPVAPSERGSQWPETWPARLEKVPYWLSSSQTGVYGKPAPEDFETDYKHWKGVVETSYLKGLHINWSNVRNVMDMRAIYGGFAAALRDLNVWVMNIVSVDSPDTLPIIYERGLFGIYHDWCESFSTYPRSYDLLHADHLFSKMKKKCNFTASIAEVDRILRPGGKIIIRDDIEIITELESMFKSMHWEILMSSKNKEGFLCAQKTIWRPNESETLTYAIGITE